MKWNELRRLAEKMDGICGVMAVNMIFTGILKRHIPFI